MDTQYICFNIHILTRTNCPKNSEKKTNRQGQRTNKKNKYTYKQDAQVSEPEFKKYLYDMYIQNLRQKLKI